MRGNEDLKGHGDGKEKANLTDILEGDHFRLLLTGCSGDSTENKGLKWGHQQSGNATKKGGSRDSRA